MTDAPRILLFLPHLDVVGGLGVHCRMLLAALSSVESPLHFLVVSPADPGRLFSHVQREVFDRNSVNPERFTFHPANVPEGFSLAGEMDVLLKPFVHTLQPDLVYCSYYTGMREPTVPQVVTFHDAGFLDHPAVFGKVADARRHTLEAMRPSLNIIHCISYDARERICRLLPWEQSKSAVIWHALPENEETLNAARAMDIANVTIGNITLAELSPYFFVPVGAATGFNRVRKNVPTAISAFRQLPNIRPRMIVAGTATLTPQVLSELLPATETGQIIQGCWWADDGRVVIVPTLERVAFLAAMTKATAVVYPSRYEGFGFPTLETMALGVPLITSRATSLPEIVEDAAILVEPDDVNGFATAMMKVLNDETLAQELVLKGKARVKHFTLTTLGHAMGQMFEVVLKKRK